MSIVHIISTLNIGGAENFVVQLANRQVLKNNVQIVVLRSTDSKRNYIKSMSSTIKLFQLNWKDKYSFLQFIKLMTLLHKMSPEVVHVHLHNPFYYVFAISIFKRKPKYVHTIHSSFKNWKKVLNLVNKLRFLNNRMLHVCLSNTIANDIIRNYPKLKNTVITNGINSHIPARSQKEIKAFWETYEIPSKKGMRFLAIGNISGNKNYRLLAKSFEAIADQYPKAICIQVGNPTDRTLTDELLQLNASNVFYAGPKESAADFLAEADALIISSIQEGMPIVALEALSMGVPIVTTPAGGMVDLVNETNGVISQNFEAESFEKAISSFLELNDSERAILSSNAKKTFENQYEIGLTANSYKMKYELE